MRLILFTAVLMASAGAQAAPPKANAAALLERLPQADANRDGLVTKTEVITFRAASFSRLDRDDNGVLTRGDIPAFAARINPDLNFNALIAQFDLNRDGVVSRTEFVDGPTAVFDLADTNKDGVLTPAERQTALSAVKRR
jgi:hypothetical protein